MGHVHRTLRHVVSRLEELGIPYAIAGSLAMAQCGYERATTDVDVLLTTEGLAQFKAAVRGLGFVEKFPGRGLRDTSTSVGIDVLIAGDYPGDGKPKAVRFPDPALVAQRGSLGQVVPLVTLIEMKLASRVSAPDRLRDLADVLELVRARQLPGNFADSLDASVRDKYRELWSVAQISREEI